MKCQLLMTGHELMTGVTIDSNSAWIAEQLDEIGIQVHRIVTIDDELNELVNEIRHAINHYDLLIVNGGLGPTDDDLTAKALSIAINSPLTKHSAAEQHVHTWCKKRRVQTNAANLKQAILPRAASIIPNASGSAVGINISQGHCLLLCTPGVPSEMKQMMSEQIIPLLLNKFPNCHQRFTKRLQIFGMGESTIQQKVHTEIPDWPKKITLGFRAGFPTLEIKLTVNNKKEIPLRDQYEKKLKALLGSVVFSDGSNSLAKSVVDALQAKKMKITTAESCTGGLIASQLTGVSGSSDIFEAGFVTYSNTMKEMMLDVKNSTLKNHGAVSEETVVEMAQGALKKTNADYVVAISGIAGPTGGTPEKPVGTVWVAWGDNTKINTHSFYYPAERHQFQNLMAAYGLDLIRRKILEIEDTPRYVR